MALFGASKRGLFGDLFGGQSPYQTPGIGDGLPGATTPTREPQFEPGAGMFGGAARRPSKWDSIGDSLTNLGQSLGAAQAFWDGDFGTGVGIQQMQQERRDKAQQAAMQEQNMAARYQRAIAAGMTPAQAAIIASGDAKFSDIYAKPTAEQQNFQTWRGFDPATRKAYTQYKDETDPLITHGYGSTVVSRAEIPQIGGLPPGYDPSEWEVVDDPGQASAPVQNDAFTPEQYQGLVNSLGQQGADAFLRRNGLTVRGR